MSKTRDTGFLANVIQVHDTGVRIMSGSEMLMAISSSGQVTITGELSGSDAANSLLLDGTGSLSFTTTASFLVVSASQQQISSSLLQVSASYISLSGSYNTFSGSASTRITTISSSQQDISSSQQQISASLLNVIAVYATTGSNSFRANQSITGSLVVSSTITAQTLVVQTVTSSIVYSSGSNIFGSALGDRQTFTGSVNITGSQTVFGNVAIGITTPFQTAKLQVNVGGNMNFAVQPGTACTTGIKLNTFVDSGASNVPLELNSSILYLKTCENSRLVINGSGISCFACQVYVGTDKLCWTDTVFKTLQVGNGAFNNTGTQTQIVNNVYYDDTNYRSLIGGPSNRLIMTGPGDLIFEYACTQAVGCIVSLSPKLFVCGTSGRVGIGITAPEYPLHIYGCAPLGMKIQTCGSSFGSPSINLLNGGVDTVLSATNTGLEIGTWSANDIIFRVTQVERMRINTSGIVTMPQQPSMFAQPGAGAFPIGTSQTAYGWCTSGSVRYNCGFTLTSATSAACNIADAQNTGKIIIPATGKYLLQFSQRNEAQCTSDGQFFLWVNGTTRIRRHIELWSTTRYIHVDVTAILPLNTGDCLEMGAWFNAAGKTDTFAGTNDTVNWLSLAKIS